MVQSRAGLEARLEALYGRGIDWARATGVVHVAAIGAASRAVLAVGAQGPASETDRFVLGFARARADAIVTTGAILRAEPDLVHRYADDPEQEAGWRRFRAERLGRSGPPELVVVTAGAALPLAHPALQAAHRSVVLTTAAGRARLEECIARAANAARDASAAPAIGSRLERVALDAPPGDTASAFLARAIDWLRSVRGHETILLESGPSATIGLYAASRPWIDELLLSVFEGEAFPAVAGPRFPDPPTLRACFTGASVATEEPPLCTRLRVRESSGPWVFERYRRRASSPAVAEPDSQA